MIKITSEEKKNGEMKRIGILVSEVIKNKWENFVDENNLTTVSHLIRKAVNFYIDSQTKISYLENISKFSHDLKEPLTAIQGFSQLILENEAKDLNSSLLVKIKEIYDQSIFLESKINEIVYGVNSEKVQYDIFIVDDDSPTLMVLSNLFESRGNTSHGVVSGKKALEALERLTPKVILLDIILPDIDGFELCKQIKSIDRFKNTPIYYISAIPGDEISKKLEETGADGFFLKPFKFSEFETIYNYL